MTDKIAAFRALHVPGDPLILVNIWDAGSAKAVAAAGAKAIATGSFGVAGAQGRADGEDFPLGDVFENLGRILSVTDLPVTIDMEAGYGADPAAVGVSVGRAKAAGAAGINMEDRLPGQSDLLSVGDAVARYRAAADTGIFVNARCDTFRGADAAKDGDALRTAARDLRRRLGSVQCDEAPVRHRVRGPGRNRAAGRWQRADQRHRALDHQCPPHGLHRGSGGGHRRGRSRRRCPAA